MASTAMVVSIASIIVVLLGFYTYDVSAIWCFQCNSQFHEDCANIAPNDTSSSHYRQCEDDDQTLKIRNGREFFCRKIVQTIYDREGLQRVVRRCGFVQHTSLNCYSYTSEGHDDVVCQCFTDACNSAPDPSSHLIFTAVSGISVTILTLLFK